MVQPELQHFYNGYFQGKKQKIKPSGNVYIVILEEEDMQLLADIPLSCQKHEECM